MIFYTLILASVLCLFFWSELKAKQDGLVFYTNQNISRRSVDWKQEYEKEWHELSFSDYLKNLRTKQGLKLREVERLTKISNSYLSQIETGKRNPPHPDILKKLAPIYEVSLKELMEKAGYLEIEDEISDFDEEKINRAYKYVLDDPDFQFGARGSLPESVSPQNAPREFKLSIINLYEKATRTKILNLEN